MKVADIIASVRQGLGAGEADPPREGLLASGPDRDVGHIVVCQSPSVGVLRAVAGQPGTLIISREHPFYLHDDTAWSLKVDTELAAAGDPVVRGKREIIETGGIAIYRLSSLWDDAFPKGQATALARALGWKVGDSGGGRKAICNIAPMSLASLARFVGDRLASGPVRVTGPRDAVVRRVALVPEFVSLADARDVAAAMPAVDAIICGESCEWEAAVYLKDTRDIGGLAISVIFAGTQPTQEPGVRAMHEWLANRLPGLPISYVDIDRPVRSLENGA